MNTKASTNTPPVNQSTDTLNMDGKPQPTPFFRLSRRSLLLHSAGALGVFATASNLLSACTDNDDANVPAANNDSAQETPPVTDEAPFEGGRYGGTLRIALIDEPPTLDIHQTTASNTALVGWHIFEALFTWDEQFQVMPEIVERYTISEDNLEHHLELREDVLFHDGNQVTARDVIASIKRWGSISGLGASLLEATDEIDVQGPHTFTFYLNRPFGTFSIALARQNQGCAIYPEWVIEESGDASLTELIGSGPYRFIEQIHDQHIRVERFSTYTPAPGEVDGYSGDKYQFLEQILFIPVADEAVRIAGLQAGDYHYLESVSPDQMETLESDPNVVAEIDRPTHYPNLVLNLRSPIFEDLRVRQAVQAALDHEPIMQAGYGDGFYRIDPSLLMKETIWYSKAGSDRFNQADSDAARRLLKQAGYADEPLRFMVTQAYQDLYNAALVIRQQLEEAGFQIDLRIYDWATLVERRDEPDLWEMYITLASFRPDPIMRNLTSSASGWWEDADKDELLEMLQSENDFDTRFQIWEQVQELFYEQVPRIKVGDVSQIIARSPMLRGFNQLTQLQPAFWNVWLRR